jgi:hypothetical protein
LITILEKALQFIIVIGALAIGALIGYTIGGQNSQIIALTSAAAITTIAYVIRKVKDLKIF